MIPNVCIAWCTKVVTCHECQQPIEAGQPEIRVFFWMRNEGKRFNYRQFFHPQCWMLAALNYLKMNPYVPHIRHKPSGLSKEDSDMRARLVRQYNQVKQQRKKLKAGPDYIELDGRLALKMAGVVSEIAQVGGVPPKWLT